MKILSLCEGRRLRWNVGFAPSDFKKPLVRSQGQPASGFILY
jgi:hypothetical protein